MHKILKHFHNIVHTANQDFNTSGKTIAALFISFIQITNIDVTFFQTHQQTKLCCTWNDERISGTGKRKRKGGEGMGRIEVVGEEIVGWKALWKEHEENL